MARLGASFDATQHDTQQNDYSELPNGVYRLEVMDSDVVPTSNGTGTILKTTNTVLEPEQYAGRKLFTNYNIENASAKAAEIGQRQFASLCRAIGKSSVDDSEELHGYGFTVKIGLGKPSKDGKYAARAEIKRYYFPDEDEIPAPAIDDNQPAATPTAANDNRRPAANNNNPPAQKAAAATGSRPWGKR
jgi:hypothetical protein